MDDDIDIEEHDVLDNPAIRNIFPDLSVIKKEISTYEDPAYTLKSEPEILEDYVKEEKCQLQSINLSQSIDLTDNDEPEIISSVEKNQSPLLLNKIILGSKPNNEHPVKNNDTIKNNDWEKNKKPFLVKISLNDIGPYLSQSKKFCKDCLILFPQKVELDKHIEACHNSNLAYKLKKNNKPTLGSKMKVYKRTGCDIAFTKSEIFVKHINTQHSGTQERNLANSGRLCVHCNKTFLSQESLIDHIYQVLLITKNRSKTETIPLKTLENNVEKAAHVHNQKQKNQNEGIKKKITLKQKFIAQYNKLMKQKKQPPRKKNIFYYRCTYCSYYLQNHRNFTIHMRNKHKDTNINKTKKVMFNANCKYCDSKCKNAQSYNDHLQKCHKEKIENIFKIQPRIMIPKVEVLLAKKPDSRKLGLVEPSTKQPKKSNERMEQIKTTNRRSEINTENNFVNLKPNFNEILLLKNALFKCMRCDIHFLSADSAASHSEHMEMLINWKCLDCKKIFKKDDENYHKQQHSFGNDFTVYELNELQFARILYKCSKCAIHFHKSYFWAHFEQCGQVTPESTYCRECDILIDKKLSEIHRKHHSFGEEMLEFTIVGSDPITNNRKQKPAKKNLETKKRKPKPKDATIKSMSKLSYCKTCKCFVTLAHFRAVHKQGKCTDTTKYICKFCGLMLTNKILGVHRKLLHQNGINYNLQNFTFYDIETGGIIVPPVPEYPKCASCEVHFLSKCVIRHHVCGENDFLTCPICDCKLSESAFKLHVAFHNYSIKRNTKTALNCALPSENKVILGQESTPIEKSLRKNNDVSTTMSTKSSTAQNVILKNSERLLDKPQLLIEDNESITKSVVNNEVIPIKTKLDTSSSITLQGPSDFDLVGVIYCCTSCSIALDTYNQAVEHSQMHYTDTDLEIVTETCEICTMKYVRNCQDEHKKLHDATSTGFMVLKFDVFYFPLDYSIWIQHIFESLEKKKSKIILGRSIYKSEVRVKMHIIQDGMSNLTVYKCASCDFFVDPVAMFNHIENSCFKVRKHPCSVCGLPFISYASRLDHENIHKHVHNITMKSYRIVLFNKDKDRKFHKKIANARNNYVLHQCRNCCGIVDKFQRKFHECNKEDLKQCLTCDLLFYSSDIDSHMTKHKIVTNFKQSNMRIVLFGQAEQCEDDSTIPMSSFKGKIFDYSFYKCMKCEICFQKVRLKCNKHVCFPESAKFVCPKCGLCVFKSKTAQHSKFHQDSEFTRENIQIIMYEKIKKDMIENLTIPATDTQKSLKLNKSTICADDNVDSTFIDENNALSQPEAVMEISERYAKLYKCVCGLHFLNPVDLRSHFILCGSRIAKQNCSKCSLLFTPNVLFSHLLTHHGNKNCVYKFNIIEMSKESNEIVKIYKCPDCNLHFVAYETAANHVKDCRKVIKDKKACDKCKIVFDNECFNVHTSDHHKSNIADVEVIEIPKGLTNNQAPPIVPNLGVQDFTDDLWSQFDVVRDAGYNLSDETLSQIDISKYSNVVYKCNKCNVYFLTAHTAKKHPCVRNTQYFDTPQHVCTICGLNFSMLSLTKHVYIHHEQMKLTMSDFVIKG